MSRPPDPVRLDPLCLNPRFFNPRFFLLFSFIISLFAPFVSLVDGFVLQQSKLSDVSRAVSEVSKDLLTSVSKDLKEVSKECHQCYTACTKEDASSKCSDSWFQTQGNGKKCWFLQTQGNGRNNKCIYRVVRI